jgi:predicted nucleic acid-binding Zn ribbon protein
LRGVAAIDEVWADVVGPGLAEHTEPAKLLDGRLSVLVDRAIFGSQLTLRGEEITAALRDRVGVAVTSLEVAVRTR